MNNETSLDKEVREAAANLQTMTDKQRDELTMGKLVAGSIGDMLDYPGEKLHPELDAATSESGGMIWIHHPMMIDMRMPDDMNGWVNRRFLAKKALIEKAEANGDWGQALALYEKPYRMQKLFEWQERIDELAWWKLFADTYIGIENWEQYREQIYDAMTIVSLRQEPTARGMATLEAVRNAMMDEDEREAFEKLPKTVTVYRGYCRECGDDGVSWTLERETAEWFARRRQTVDQDKLLPVGIVIRATFWRDATFGYFTRRDESEVIALPIDALDISEPEIIE